MAWEVIGNIKGPKGDTGDTGATGPQGPAGQSVTIVGSVANAAALPGGLGPGDTGDGYITQDDGHLHVWDGDSFNDVGTVQGPPGLSAYEVAVENGFVGDEAAWLLSLIGPAGEDGNAGTPGATGWSPVLAVVDDGARRVLQIVDWTGGTGTEPSSSNQYIGPSGIVSSAAAAVDIRGPQGVQGDTGATGATGNTGSTGTRGSLWYTGAGAPGTISGQLPGDKYLNLSNGDIYNLV